MPLASYTVRRKGFIWWVWEAEADGRVACGAAATQDAARAKARQWIRDRHAEAPRAPDGADR